MNQINSSDEQATTVQEQDTTAYQQNTTTHEQDIFILEQRPGRQSVVAVFNISLITQLLRFGIVGLTAAAIHFSIVVFFVQIYAFEPLIANIFAFMASFQASIGADYSK